MKARMTLYERVKFDASLAVKEAAKDLEHIEGGGEA
jgi:hypothetical protein